jgi:hypothetical protein
MEGIRDQADDQIVLCNFGIESVVICDVERDGMGVLDTFRELLSALEGSASYRIIRLTNDHPSICFLPTET